MNTISSNDDELPLNHSRQFIWHLNRHNTNTNTPPDLGGAAASRLMGGYDVSLSSPRRPGPPPELYTNLDRPPVTPLPKGKACLECRRRKVRCDAQSPCKACIRMQKECIYEEEEERIRRLLVEVEELEMKLQLMEERKGDVGEGGEKVAAGGTVEQVAVTPSNSDTEMATAEETTYASPDAYSSIGSPSTTSETLDFSGDWWKSDPPPAFQRYLVDLFFEKSRSGFRVHRGRFTKSLTLPPKSQPHPGLLYVIYVIACRFSENPLLTCHESTFLARARVHLAQSLAKKDRLVHFLAGSTLLAYYLLISGRFLEGAHEISTASRFAMVCNLHKIPGPVWTPPSLLREDTFQTRIQAGIYNTPLLPPPIDAIDLGERISLFWATILLDHSGSLVTGLPSNIPYEEIETVWPRPLEHYEQGLVSESHNESVGSLFDPSTESSPCSDTVQIRHLKAIVLLERVSRFSSFGAACTPEERNSPEFISDFDDHYDAVIRFTESLPPLNLPPSEPAFSPGAASPTSSTGGSPKPDPLYLVHMYSHVAFVHLYNAISPGGGPQERLSKCYQKRLHSAKKAVRDIRALDAYGSEFEKLPMMVGFAWGSIAHVHAQYVKEMETTGDEEQWKLAQVDLFTITEAIRIMCNTFPILEFQLEKIREYGVPIFPSDPHPLG